MSVLNPGQADSLYITPIRTFTPSSINYNPIYNTTTSEMGKTIYQHGLQQVEEITSTGQTISGISAYGNLVRLTTMGAGSSVILPAGGAGMYVTIVNETSNNITLQVETGESLNGVVNGTYSLQTSKRLHHVNCTASGLWWID